MANELQQTLARIINKSNILIEKYHALEQASQALATRNEQLLDDIEQMKKNNELMRQEIEYLKMARVIAPDIDNLDHAKATISKMVRDIDKCISQLNGWCNIMATDDKTLNILIRIADVEPIALTIPRDEEANYREAEKLVNTLWNKWVGRFEGENSSQSTMAMVAFQFARLYSKAYNQNVAVNNFLTTFEQQLNDVVVKI